MNLNLELNAQEADRLRMQAQALGITPEELAHSVLTDLLAEPDDNFRAVAERVIIENRELYRRLS